jgi:hypothetical protein
VLYDVAGGEAEKNRDSMGREHLRRNQLLFRMRILPGIKPCEDANGIPLQTQFPRGADASSRPLSCETGALLSFEIESGLFSAIAVNRGDAGPSTNSGMPHLPQCHA